MPPQTDIGTILINAIAAELVLIRQAQKYFILQGKIRSLPPATRSSTQGNLTADKPAKTIAIDFRAIGSINKALLKPETFTQFCTGELMLRDQLLPNTVLIGIGIPRSIASNVGVPNAWRDAGGSMPSQTRSD